MDPLASPAKLPEYALHLFLSGFSYPDKSTNALGSLELKLRRGECLALMGPSGCGKTTAMKLLAGLLPIPPDGGKAIGPDGRTFNSGGNSATPPGIAAVFQEAARSLLPWRTVWENVQWAIRDGAGKSVRHDIIIDAINAVGLEKKKDSFPYELSGGQAQKLALARAIAHQPSVLLLDEPFSSLDVFGRQSLEDLVLSLKAKYDLSVFLVTHEADEAVLLGDRVEVLTRAPGTIYKTISSEDVKSRDGTEFHRVLGQLHSVVKKLRTEIDAKERE